MQDKLEKRQDFLNRLQREKSLSPRDSSLVERASGVLVDNAAEVPGAAWGTYRGILSSPTAYRGVWNWDAAFHTLGTAYWDADLSKEQFLIFFHSQMPDGMFPDVLFADGRRMDNYSKPPVFPWALSEFLRAHPDLELAELGYACFCRNEQFWLQKRFDEGRGLFHYDATPLGSSWQKNFVWPVQDRNSQQYHTWRDHICWETGMDNSVRWDHGCRELWPVDLNAFMVMFYDAMIFLSDLLGKQEADMWKEKRDHLVKAMEETLWCAERQAYLDVFRCDGSFSDALTPASFLPLYAHCASQQRAAHMAEHAANPNEFFPSLPMIAFNHPCYDARWYWRGPTWLNMAYFAMEGLEKYGFDTLAGQLRESMLNTCDREKRDIFEYYDSRTGEGLGASHFGWSSAFLLRAILRDPQKFQS